MKRLSRAESRGRPVVLAIGGWDPSGRAGLLADAWAIDRAGGRIAGVVTAVTVQGDAFGCFPIAAGEIGLQLRAAVEASSVSAIKIGMVANRTSLQRIFSELRSGAAWVVIDPVVRTSRGESLSSLTARDFLRLAKQFGAQRRLLLTPNRDELRWLGVTPQQLVKEGYAAVVVKGGGSGVDEVFARHGPPAILRGSSLARSPLHHRGTGCRFGSGLAAGLARGEDLVAAVRGAKRLVRKFLSG